MLDARAIARIRHLEKIDFGGNSSVMGWCNSAASATSMTGPLYVKALAHLDQSVAESRGGNVADPHAGECGYKHEAE
jgi:hypothetical protein